MAQGEPLKARIQKPAEALETRIATLAGALLYPYRILLVPLLEREPSIPKTGTGGGSVGRFVKALQMDPNSPKNPTPLIPKPLNP